MALSLLICTWFSALSAHACFTVRLNNESSQSVHVIWAALGCGKIYTSKNLVAPEGCRVRTVHAGQTSSYSYPWGTTAPTLWLDYTFHTRYGSTGGFLRFIYDTHHFVQAHDEIFGMTPGCKRHFSVTVTDADLGYDT
ncbi:hypothetical protein [Hyphomonas sp.]|uniref:hypothetical protein n=1 Tax=Hyphomonas sp. TaxID=87 RepID=UPI0025BDE659|nr:hypothetical protein [Hyphomonas sp.]